MVGAGPGDPELLTVAAVKALGTAELVIADRLIPEEVLGCVGCLVGFIWWGKRGVDKLSSLPHTHVYIHKTRLLYHTSGW